MRGRARLLGAVAAVVALAALAWRAGFLDPVWRGVVDGSTRISGRYGLDVPLTLAGFATAQIVYIAAIVMMLHASDARHVRWADVRAFNVRRLNLGDPRILAWWWVNRASWAVFWGVVIAVTWGRVPWWATGAAFTDIGLNLFWGVVWTLGLRMPWWNEPAEDGLD